MICSSKAQEFVQNDERFEIVPDAIINSSIIITKKDNPQTIGVSQNRKFEVDMVKDTFGEECEIKEISTRVLPYALEKGEVDGIVLDYIKSLEIEGKRVFMKEDKNYNTFSLVIKKSIKDNIEYKKFIKAFNKVREEIMEPDAFIEIISRERNKNYLDDRRRYEWQMLRLQITPLEE
ncbi:NLPA lipoprotein [Clostridium collagenovorans DSM 3089]|uniref:NLPA lipoprotein n=1 Tax=Clostridium collagenovorans DSM 3089 TaxID=1121306 RepID=A0A1M5XAN8_9CLOT|nr:MetQ/NlpA family ABC transporter substrate-binding protein [Clostridium collagenovorans]SHH96574.1 NLPA lipoprotein [Clostridium collagenovorans DSM 3089]